MSHISSDRPRPARVHVHDKEFTLRSTAALVGAFLALFCTLGLQNAFGVFQEYYVQTVLKENSAFEVAWIGSLLTFMIFFFSAPAGIMVDRFGPTPLLVFGSLATIVGAFITSLCNHLYQFLLAQGVLMGLGNAFLLCPAMATVSHLFDRHRGAANGIMISGSSFGGIIWPLTMDQLLHDDAVSFDWTFRIVGFIVLPLSIIIVLTVRPKTTDTPTLQNGESSDLPPSEKPDPKASVAIIKNPTYLMLCAGLCLATFGLFSPFFFIPTYAVARGLSASLSFYLISMLNGASLVGRVSTGYLADRYGNFNLAFLMVGLSGIIAMCWTQATSKAGIIVFTLAYGYTSGAMFSLQTPCAVQLATPESRGTAIGLLFVAPSIPGLVGTPISGHLVDRGYLALSMFSGATLLGGAFLILGARLRQHSGLFTKV